jgi:2'-hydroxyisoflavone reductase
LKLLVLGGTLFLGRHVVEAALEQGHEITLFNRGQTNPDLFPTVEHLRGDRGGDLSPLAGREWDAVVDPSMAGISPTGRLRSSRRGREARSTRWRRPRP